MTQIFVNGKGATFGIPDDAVVVQNGGIWEFYGPGTPAKTVQGPTGPINYPAVRGPKLNLPTDLTPYTPTAADLLADGKMKQIALIRSGFEASTLQSVTDANGISWSGGESSGSRIFLACQLAQQLGLPSVDLWDSANTKHTMTIANGMTVAATIGAAYQTDFHQWQTLRDQVLAITDTSAAGITAVQSIVWVSP